MDDTQRTVIESYSYPLLEGVPKILNYNEDIRNFILEDKIKNIVDKWRGVPLKGPAQEEFVNDFIQADITDEERRPINTFKKCCTQLKKYNIELRDKQANKKDLERWPRYLTQPREKFKIIT